MVQVAPLERPLTLRPLLVRYAPCPVPKRLCLPPEVSVGIGAMGSANSARGPRPTPAALGASLHWRDGRWPPGWRRHRTYGAGASSTSNCANKATNRSRAALFWRASSARASARANPGSVSTSIVSRTSSRPPPKRMDPGIQTSVDSSRSSAARTIVRIASVSSPGTCDQAEAAARSKSTSSLAPRATSPGESLRVSTVSVAPAGLGT